MLLWVIFLLSFARSTIFLNGDKWQFAPGKNPQSEWVDIRVPSTWKNHEFNFNTNYGFAGSDYSPTMTTWTIRYTEGWYKIKFPTPKQFENKGRIFLEVRRANHFSDYFLNGKRIGSHNTAFVPFRADITEVLKENGYNTLIVHVKDGEHANFDIGNTHSITKYYIKKLGGLEGNVLLGLLPALRVDEVFIDTSVREKEIQIRYSLVNSTNKSRIINITPTILNKEDSVVLSFPSYTIEIPPHSGFSDTLTKKWENPTLWGFGKFGKSYLYRLNIRLSYKGETLDNINEKFGFRELWNERNRFYLNGKEIFLYGDNPGSGITFLGVLNRYWARYMIKAEREANINYIRTHTFIPPESWMEECDKMGMLLEPEFLISRDDNFMEHEKSVVKKVVKEYYNHPSIFMWSLDNESVSQIRKVDRKMLKKHKIMHELIRNIDPNRLIDDQGNVFLGLAHNWGINFYPEVFNMHPYGDPLKNRILQYKKEFNYQDSVPLLIGEISYCNANRWMNQIKKLAMDQKYAWERYNKAASYFKRSVTGARTAGAEGVAPHKTLTLGYWGPVSPDSFVAGPFNFTETSKTLYPVSWPAFSGAGPKVDNIYLWSWHSSQFNWFDKSKAAYTTTIVHKKVKEAYQEITGDNLPSIDSTDYRDIIVYAPRCKGYVYLQHLNGFDVSVYGILPDQERRAWFRVDKRGRYKIWYIDKNKKKKEKILEVKNNRTPISPGYKVLHLNLP